MRLIFLTILTYFLVSAQLYGQGLSWAQSFGVGVNSASAGPIAIEANNNILVGVHFSGTIDVDQGPGIYNVTAVGINNLLLLKEDAIGNFVWAKQFNGRTGASILSVIACYDIALDGVGNIYLAGSITDSFDLDPGPSVHMIGTPPGQSHGYVIKLDPSGDFVWARQLGGASGSNAGVLGMRVDATGNVYIAGSIAGTIDVDPGSATLNFTSSGNADIFFEKLNSAGDLVWARQIGSNLDDQPQGLAIDGSFNLYLTGKFNTAVDFDPGSGVAILSSAGVYDIFAAKYDSAGNYIWAKSVGGSGNDIGHDIAVDNFGNVMMTGYYATGTVDFDPGPGVYNITANSRDMFVLRLRDNGDFSWAVSVHPSGNDDGRAIVADDKGNIYTTGEFFTMADFDPGSEVYLLSGGAYVQKLDSTGNFLWARAFEADIPGWIELDYANNIYVTGRYTGPADFDPGPGSFLLNGNNAGFIEKLCGSSLALTANDSTICSGSNAQLTTPATSGATYIWTKDGTTIAGSSNTISVSQAGAYEVYVNGGCPSASGPVYISVDPLIIPTITISGPTGELVGQPVTINANVANAGPSYSINWKNNNVSFATTTVPSVTYTKQPGADNITAFITSTSPGCYDSTLSNNHKVFDITGIPETMKAAGIEVYPNPFEDALTVKGLKANDKLILADITGRIIYTWQASQQIQTFAINDLAPGHYMLKIANENGKLRVNVPVVKK